MTGRREQNVQQLLEAANMLGPVGAMSVRPVQCINPALELVRAAYADLENYASSADRGRVRVCILRLQGVSQALAEGRRVDEADYRAVRETGNDLTALATLLEERNTRRPTMAESATGARLSGVRGVAGPAVMVHGDRRHVAAEETDEHWVRAEEHREGLPRRVPSGRRFVVYRCPIVAYLKRFVDDKSLDRAGLQWTRMQTGAAPMVTGLSREKGDQHHGVILADQILVGFNRDELKADPGGLVLEAQEQLQARTGVLVAPLGEPRAKPSPGDRPVRFLVSPGCPLDWLWLVPARVMSATHMTVAEANFPWRTDHVSMTEQQVRDAHREVQQITERVQAAQRAGRDISAWDLTRQSQLMEQLDRNRSTRGPTDAERREGQREVDELEAKWRGRTMPPADSERLMELKERLGTVSIADRRRAMEAVVAQRTAKQRALLLDLQGQLADIQKAPEMDAERKTLRAKIKATTEAVEKIKLDEMRKARAAMQAR